MRMDFFRTNSANQDFLNLVQLLDKDLEQRYGKEIYAKYINFNTVEKINYVLVVRNAETPLGCGALKPYSEQTWELKRFYLVPSYRGQGIAREMLVKLESWVRELGGRKVILCSGIKQPEACRCYEKHGYRIIPNYPPYEGMDEPVCMEKVL